MSPRKPRRPGRASSDAERRALAKASGRRTSSRPAPRTRAGFATLWCDGGSRGNPGPAAIGYVLNDADGTELARHAAPIGEATAGAAEYLALEAGLTCAVALGVDRLDARSDSKLVVDHLNGDRVPRNADLAPLCTRVVDVAQQLGTVTFTWIPADGNGDAHALVAQELGV